MSPRVARSQKEMIVCGVSRRDTLLATVASSAALQLSARVPFALADEELVVYYGAANPPATYGGIGGTTKDKARYSFVHPESWQEDAISKVEKGANGTDARFSSQSRSKKEQVYVVSLVNEGGRTLFKTNDPERALDSISGADATFQDAIAYGEVSISTRETENGDKFFDYFIDGGNTYAVSLTARQGRIFAIFINASARNFQADKEMLSKIQESFRTYEVDVLY
eukprot:CAMPEP_0114252362 /NCGR_PEP_ID=MMETSP0058-20121206/15791_1 /TAXON_ID=36894 /ORGANISM="Pyramimonas parkeae, CCMP726" /LENGTH=224 /DNA_ID=CAMNT_0001366281 /DNA_START=146 /DNA_END=820 /DNA_ORIENTATION=+